MSGNQCFSCTWALDSELCSQCNTPLCPATSEPHSFVNTMIATTHGMGGQEFHQRMMCSNCGEFQCPASKGDVHRFDSTDCCCTCHISRCHKTRDTHVVSNIIIDGITLNQCVICGLILCNHGNRLCHHIFDNGRCTNCGNQECKNGNVHIFTGPDKHCIFCPGVMCMNSPNGQCHTPVVTSNGLMCQYCQSRICPNAYFRMTPLITICHDDGTGCCLYCGRGLCTRIVGKMRVTVDHDFVESKPGFYVCRYCGGSKCGDCRGSW